MSKDTGAPSAAITLDEFFEATKDHEHEPGQDDCPTCGPYELKP